MTEVAFIISATLAKAKLAIAIEKLKSGKWQSQPRHPAGSAQGGEWTTEQASSGSRSAPKPPEKPQSAEQNGPAASGPAASGPAAQKAAKVNLSARESEAMLGYTGAMFRTLNPRLRAGKGPLAEDKTDLKHMDAAFAKASTAEDMVVYRGVTGDFFQKLTVGSEFVDGGFVSTTSDLKAARNFLRGDRSENVLMEIKVPKGSKAISLGDIGAFAKTEQEILLNRGGKFRVIEQQKATRTRPAKVVMEYVDA